MNTLDFRDYVLDMVEHLSLVPLCQEICHIEIHTIGIREFQDRHGINLWRENARLLARWIWTRLGQ